MTQTHSPVTRHWPTGVVIDDVDLTGIVDDRLVGDLHPDGVPFERLSPSAVIADQAALIAEFLTSNECAGAKPGGRTRGGCGVGACDVASRL